MAKLIFGNVDNISYEVSVGACSTDQDLTYLIGDSNKINEYKSFDITEDEYDGLFDGSKSYEISNNAPVIIDHTMSTETVSEEEFKNQYDNYKQALGDKIEHRVSHSKISEAQSCLNYLNSLDLSSLSYPHVNLFKKLKDENKYVGLAAF